MKDVHGRSYFPEMNHSDKFWLNSAGTEGFDFVPPTGCNNFGRYEIALLCLGMMQFHFGHPKQALEVSLRAGLSPL